MAELAPGLFVTNWLEPGTAYVLNVRDLGMGDFGERGQGLIVAEADWNRIEPAERERIADDIMRGSAEAGFERMTKYLATQPTKENQ